MPQVDTSPVLQDPPAKRCCLASYLRNAFLTNRDEFTL